MNFIGHATVALWTRHDPGFVLGSMLPDFATMAATRLNTTGGDGADAISAGIALHHRTDAVFHAAHGFVSLMQEALDTLSAQGVPRGTARAVGHIGVEMLIDGELLADAQVAASYTEALREGAAIDGYFRDEAGATRYAALRTRLLAHGVPYDYGDPRAVLRRLHYVLVGRPRLAIDARSAETILAMLPGLQRKVVLALPALIEELRTSLA